jgi:copper chaperone
MSEVTYKVPSIHCGHCVHTIEMEVGELDGVESVTASLETKEVNVQFDNPASNAEIVALLKEISYPPEDL